MHFIAHLAARGAGQWSPEGSSWAPRHLICTSRRALRRPQPGTCPRRGRTGRCSRSGGGWPGPRGCTSPAAAAGEREGGREGAVRRCTARGTEAPADLGQRPRPAPACLEVDGVHAQVVGVQVGQVAQGGAQVVHVLEGVLQGLEHLLAVVAHVAGPVAQVEVREVRLGGRVDRVQPTGGRERAGAVRAGSKQAVTPRPARPGPAYLVRASPPRSSQPDTLPQVAWSNWRS